MPFNFSSPEYLSHHRTRKNRVNPVSRASPAHMNSPLQSNLRLGHRGVPRAVRPSIYIIWGGGGQLFICCLETLLLFVLLFRNELTTSPPAVISRDMMRDISKHAGLEVKFDFKKGLRKY